MSLSSIFSKQKSILGVDIGTANIKVAQISHGSSKVLDTYGIVNLTYQIDNHNNTVAISQTAEILAKLLKQARTTTKRCVVSLPNSAVFTSVIEMPKMSQKELASSIEYEAKKYIPLPLSEVALSWSEVSGDEKNLKILLTAVPNQVRESYVKVFELAGLELEVIEIEALALIRSLISDASKNSVIIDIGAKSTGLNVIRNGFLQLTRNLNIGGDTITNKIAQSLNLSYLRAEQFKKDFGVSEAAFIPEAIKPILNLIKNEVKQLINIYQSHDTKLDKLILVGGGSNLPGIVDFFKDLGVTVDLGDPLKTVAYPKAGAPIIQRFGLQLPIAIGLALRNE